jgi:ABC-type thiamine transport system substrate-binding protein
LAAGRSSPEPGRLDDEALNDAKRRDAHSHAERGNEMKSEATGKLRADEVFHAADDFVEFLTLPAYDQLIQEGK